MFLIISVLPWILILLVQMPTDFIPLSSYGFLGTVNLSEYLIVPEAIKKGPTKRKEKTLDPKARQETEQRNRVEHMRKMWESRENGSTPYRFPPPHEGALRSV